jgi:uncharacterized membrane protein HdeD (DUF308 family)
MWCILDKKSLALLGIVAVLFGLLAIVATKFVLDFLVYIFGFFAILTGISELGLAFAIILVLIPVLSAYALVIVLGIYALVFGFISIFLGFSMGRQKVVVETRTFL